MISKANCCALSPDELGDILFVLAFCLGIIVQDFVVYTLQALGPLFKNVFIYEFLYA